MEPVKLRLIITVDYVASPRDYGTDDPTEMAIKDYRNLLEGNLHLVDFVNLSMDNPAVNYAITPVPD